MDPRLNSNAASADTNSPGGDKRDGSREQSEKAQWRRGARFHAVGTALVANSVNTYAFPLLFSKCTSADLRMSCDAYGPNIAPLLNFLASMHVVNLLLRFMVLIGFGLDFLALAYVVLAIRSLAIDSRAA